MMTDTALATTSETAEYLRMRDQSLRRLRMEGRGPKYIKVSNRVMYRWSDVEAWLAEHEHDPEHATPAPRRPVARTRAGTEERSPRSRASSRSPRITSATKRDVSDGVRRGGAEREG
jgi:Helix-turn-helix domain